MLGLPQRAGPRCSEFARLCHPLATSAPCLSTAPPLSQTEGIVEFLRTLSGSQDMQQRRRPAPEQLLLPNVDVTRREFTVTTLAAGFALAVQPVSAETITTDTNGLEAGEVKIPVADGTMPAYRAMPADGRAVPGRAGRAGDLRRPRAHQGYLPPARQARLPGRRPRAVRPAGRRVEDRRTSRRSSPRSSRRCPTPR